MDRNTPQLSEPADSNIQQVSSVEPPRPPIGSATDAPDEVHVRRFKEAVSYIIEVKQTFRDMPSVVDEFLNILMEHSARGGPIDDSVRRVVALFRGHPNLILGFLRIVYPPPGLEYSLSTGTESQIDSDSRSVTSFSNVDENVGSLN